ncbi:MAG: hypothetical protein HC924_19315 [Synechococcaceae cyanobacterium SM2_3_2]|nr:hypothetical protein [Synechococcaceae cyanobacterium SM2_3_2]
MLTDPGTIISTILKHDSKVTSYKIALLRAINDGLLSFPDLGSRDVAIPLRLLAEFWVAYYWPFMDEADPIWQGQRSTRGSQTVQDVAFRPLLTQLRQTWQTDHQTLPSPADGFLLIHDLRIPRKRATHSAALLKLYQQTLRKICAAIEYPIQYAGPGGSHWTVFAKPALFQTLQFITDPLPGTQLKDKCLVIPQPLWQTFRSLSLWVEALCIHQWCLFTETTSPSHDRGQIYRLLTARPDNRRPLTWERNNIDILLLEGQHFHCPWTAKRILTPQAYELDHLMPVSVYPINELWNLVPADPHFNAHIKSNRLPSPTCLEKARPHLQLAYDRYQGSPPLYQALQEDVALRFPPLAKPENLAHAVVQWLAQVADSRNLARFDCS